MAGITKDTPNPTNGLVVKDPRTGEPTGHLKESAHRPGQQGHAEAHRRGPACRVAQGGGARAPVRRHERAERRQPASTTWRSINRRCAPANCRCGPTWPCRPRPARPRPTSTAWRRLARVLGNDPTLTTGAVKIYADGVIESRTAAMLAPYDEQPRRRRTQHVGRPAGPPRGDGRQARMADLHPRHWRSGHPDVARRLRARRGGQPRTGPRPAASARAHRGRRRGRHPALRQAGRHRVAAADARAARRHELRAPVRPVAGQRRRRTRTRAPGRGRAFRTPAAG